MDNDEAREIGFKVGRAIADAISKAANGPVVIENMNIVVHAPSGGGAAVNLYCDKKSRCKCR